MANTLKIKRGTAATIPQGQLAEPLFTTDTYDLYIGKGSGGNQRFQKYIASGTSSQFLKGDGSLDSTTYQATSEKGQNNGYASLDAGGKIPVSQLPSSVIEYKGTWNASTNTPTLADGTGDAGDVYIVSVGGTQNLGSGSITFAAGDWVMYNGSVWQKSTGSNAVASVNGQTGIVSIGVNDLDDTTITSPSNGQLLQYSTGTNKWVNWTPNYVPYTGATADVDLGFNNFDANQINGFQILAKLNGTGSSPLILKTGTSGYSYGSDAISLISSPASANTLTIISDVSSVNKIAQFGLGSLTATRTYTLPDATGTLALTSNIPANIITGTGTNNEIAYFNTTGSTIASLSTATYPSLTELSYVKGVTSAIQTQLNAKAADADVVKLTGNQTVGGIKTFSLAPRNESGLLLKEGSATASSGYIGLSAYNFSGNKGILIGFSTYSMSLYFNDTTSQSYTFPNASGTVALTSNLSSYLPLTGGTLTGALNGTSSSMSSTSTATAFIPTGSTVPTNGMYLPSANTVAFAANSTRVIQISDSGRVSIGATTPTADTLTVHGAITTTNGGKITAQGMIEAGSTIFGGLNCIIVSDLSAASITPTGSTAPLTGMYTASSGELSFSTGTQKRFSIASGGAATFSSNIINNITTATTTQLTLNNTNNSATQFTHIGAFSGNSYWSTNWYFNGSQLYDDNTKNSAAIVLNSDGSINLNTANSGNTVPSAKLSISSNGAATFSSSAAGYGITLNHTSENLRLKMGAIAGGIINIQGEVISSGGVYPIVLNYLGGNVGIGTPSPSHPLQVNNPTGNFNTISMINNSSNLARLAFVQNGSTTLAYTAIEGDGRSTGYLAFRTNDTERMRITSGGYLKASNNGSYENSTGTYHEFNSNTNGNVAIAIRHTGTSSLGGVVVKFPNATPNNTSDYFIACSDSTNDKAIIYSSGTYGSRTGTYGSIVSDIRYKENIFEATPKLNDIMKLRVVNYNFIDDKSIKQIGFIAQEMEEVFPSLVFKNDTRKYDDDGNLISGFEDARGLKVGMEFAILVKAMQEQQAQIEQLKAKLN